jgi:DNA modification methylase
MVQDVWWWNISTLPCGVSSPRERGLLRQSVRACVWVGDAICYRYQDAVLWEESDRTKAERYRQRLGRQDSPSGHGVTRPQIAKVAEERGGCTPFNLLPISNNDPNHVNVNGHGAGTPLALMDWWLRYIVPPGGLVVDPFMGSGTTAVAAIKQRKYFFGCDTVPEYVDIANERIAKAREETAQMELAL